MSLANTEYKFFTALVYFKDESPNDAMECVFSELDCEDALKADDEYSDDDIFHYGMSYEEARASIGKEIEGFIIHSVN